MPATASRPRRAARPAPRRVPFTFQCTECEVVEHRPSPVLPMGWVTVEFGADIHAYCGECAPEAIELAAADQRFVDLGRRLQAIATAFLVVPTAALGVFLVADHLLRWAVRA